MALMTLVQTRPEMGACRPTEYYYPAPVMIYGKYDDYGGMENCYGTEIEYLLQEFIDNHTLEEDTSVEVFTTTGDSGGLYFADLNTFHKKLKGEKNAGIPVQHVAIKMSVLNRFLDKYYFTDYHILKDTSIDADDEKRFEQDNYVPINYKFLRDAIPAYIAKLKEHIKYDEDDPALRRMILDPVPAPNWDDPDILGRWIHSFTRDVAQDFYRSSFIDRLQTLARNNEDEELTSCLQEFCKYMLIYSYINYS